MNKKLVLRGSIGALVLISLFFISKITHQMRCDDQLQFLSFGKDVLEYNDGTLSFKYPAGYKVQTIDQEIEEYSKLSEQQKDYYYKPLAKKEYGYYLTLSLPRDQYDKQYSLLMRVYHPLRDIELNSQSFTLNKRTESDLVTSQKSIVTKQQDMSKNGLTILRQMYEELDNELSPGNIERYLFERNGKAFQFTGRLMETRDSLDTCRMGAGKLFEDIVKTVNIN